MPWTTSGNQAQSSRSRADLRAELDRCDVPRHLALFYESTDTQLDGVTAFLQQGLTTDHRCLYRRSRQSASGLDPEVLHRGAVCQSPFYIPPDQYRSTADAHLNARLMMEQAYSLSESRRRVRRHEERLEVVNRILRHNIRNDLNVVQLHLESLRSDGTTADSDGRLDTALRHVTQVLDMADRARYIQETLEASTVKPIRLGETIEAAVNQVTGTHPDAEIDVAGPLDVSVLSDTNLELAISETLTNGIIHQERDPSTVAVTISMPTDGVVRIDVRTPGTIPDIERQSVCQGSETQLRHASGLGLWLVQWVVENSHGSLSFPDAGDTTVQIELTRVPA